jgi:hypothetical protein
VNSQNNTFPMLTLWHLASGISITHCDAQKTPNDWLRWQHLMAFLMQILLKFQSYAAPTRHLIPVPKG